MSKKILCTLLSTAILLFCFVSCENAFNNSAGSATSGTETDTTGVSQTSAKTDASKGGTDTSGTSVQNPDSKETRSEIKEKMVSLFGSRKLGRQYTVGDAQYDIDCDALQFINTTFSDYTDFVDKLKSSGFAIHADNGDDGFNKECYASTLYNQYWTINVSFFPKTKETFVTIEEFTALSPLQLGTAKTAYSDITSIHLLPLNAFGDSIVFRLSNGHFVIIDGAQEHNSQLTVEYLENLTPEGEIPVVDAWFFSHAHPDHTYCAWGIGKDESLVNRIRVEGFYFTWPNDEGARKENSYDKLKVQISNVNSVIPNFRTTKGEIPNVYKLHAGMRFFIEEIEVRILLTQDQIMPAEYSNGFNDSSTSMMFIVRNKNTESSFLFMGDASSAVCNKLMYKYSAETLHCTFFKTLHHGNNDAKDFFQYIHPDYLLYTNTSPKWSSGYDWLQKNTKAYFTPSAVIYLPLAK
jgi:beta-lactamase superfamily II metal-dependent hydrolase